MNREPRRSDKDRHPIRSRSFILRLWRVDELQMGEWLASLEDPSTKERFGFSGLEQLFAFLMELSERDSGMSGGVSTNRKGGG